MLRDGNNDRTQANNWLVFTRRFDLHWRNSHLTSLEEPITSLLTAGYATVHFLEKHRFLNFKTEKKYRNSSSKVKCQVALFQVQKDLTKRKSGVFLNRNESVTDNRDFNIIDMKNSYMMIWQALQMLDTDTLILTLKLSGELRYSFSLMSSGAPAQSL